MRGNAPDDKKHNATKIKKNLTAIKQPEGLFTLQYGITIRSFRQHMVTLGSDTTNDFVLPHQQVSNRHTKIYFQNNHYYLSIFSDSCTTLLNGKLVNNDVPLQENDIIVFGNGGPEMRYLGTGRLAEAYTTEYKEKVAEESYTNPLPDPALKMYPDVRYTHKKKASIKNLLKAFFYNSF